MKCHFLFNFIFTLCYFTQLHITVDLTNNFRGNKYKQRYICIHRILYSGTGNQMIGLQIHNNVLVLNSQLQMLVYIFITFFTYSITFSKPLKPLALNHTQFQNVVSISFKIDVIYLFNNFYSIMRHDMGSSIPCHLL